jgi:protein-disulfide isomerase
MAHQVVGLLRQHYGSRIRFVFRHFPLSQVHPNANSAAQTAEFAGSQGKFWQMHDGLYDNQDRLGSTLFFALASALGLSNDKLRAALINGTFESKVRADFMGGIRSGVNGTPTFFVNGRRHEGTYAFEDLGGAIEEALHVHAPT